MGYDLVRWLARRLQLMMEALPVPLNSLFVDYRVKLVLHVDLTVRWPVDIQHTSICDSLTSLTRVTRLYEKIYHV